MSQQGERQASVREATGTENSYEGDFHALWDIFGIPPGDYNGRFISWASRGMGRDFANINEAMQAIAESYGAYNWSSLGKFDATLGAFSPNDLLGLDFQLSLYKEGDRIYGSPSDLSGWDFSRTGAGYAQTLGGELVSFPTDVLRRTDRGALVETAATNQMPWSSNFGHSAWSKTGATVTDNAETAPDGTTTADRINLSAGTSGHSVNANTSNADTPSQWSVLAKAGTHSLIQITSSPNTFYGNFDLDAGIAAAGVGCTTAIAALSGGWFRCSLLRTASFTPNGGLVVAAIPDMAATRWPSWTADGTETFALWGANLTQGATLFEPIATDGSAVTRGADALTVSIDGGTGSEDITVEYGDSSSTTFARSSLADPDVLDLGAGSGGPWVNNYIRRVTVHA